MTLVLRASSTQYHVVLVVVCFPELSAWDISFVNALALGTSKLIRVLFRLQRAQEPMSSCPQEFSSVLHGLEC